MPDCLKISGYLSAYLVADLAGELVFGTGTQVAPLTIFFGMYLLAFFFVTEIHRPSWKLLSPRSGVSSSWLQKYSSPQCVGLPGVMNSEIQKNPVVSWKSNRPLRSQK